MAQSQFRRVVLKLSGEAFADSSTGFGIDAAVVQRIADEVAEARQQLGVEIAVVVGGGNIWRGMSGATRGMDRARADYMGMLATVINALALQDALEAVGQPTRVQTAITMAQVAEPFVPLRAIRHLEKGRVVIFAAGLGVPYFSTDTCAAQRALEINADALLKGTKVDGVYTADPVLDPTADRIEALGYSDFLREGYGVMDATAVSLCMENKLPILVFNLRDEGNIRRVVTGEQIGTMIH
ncbi:MAG TPA: UMP kinase [Acidimicrobiia bacterium]|nr:UMP kinase [Acidimicrobiia bacterium]